MRKLVVLTLIAGALIGTSPAQAHVLPHAKFSKIKNEKARLIARRDYLEKVIRHDKTTIEWFRKQAGGWEPFGAEAVIASASWRQHRQSLRIATSTLVRVNARLYVLSLPPHYKEWLCIHSYEGDWEDGGDPYWGGLQMDRQFQSTYGADMLAKYGYPIGPSGPNGWVNPWTPLEQMWVAERAYASGRGFYPWPNTARYCGLI